MERMINKKQQKLRRWLELPKSLSSAALYGTTNALQLPFSNLKEEFVLTRTRKVQLIRDSMDIIVKAKRIQRQTGSIWSALRKLLVAEERLKQKALVRTIAKGKVGLGCFPFYP